MTTVPNDAAAALIGRLAAVRRARRMSQAELAAKLGITQTAVSYWEAGKRDVSLSDYVRWATALGQAVTPGEVSCEAPAIATEQLAGSELVLRKPDGETLLIKLL